VEGTGGRKVSFENQLPPYSNEAEIAVLGAALLSPDALEKMLDLLTASDFYRAGHKLIFQAFANMASKSIDVDIVTLQEELRSNGKFEESGGLAYLMVLMDQLPTVGNFEHYAKIVMQKSIRRNLIDAATLVTGLAYQEAMNLDKVLEQSESAISKVCESNTTTVKSYINSPQLAVEFYNNLADRADLGIRMRGKPCGFSGIDDLLSGLAEGDLIVVAARPAMGKSAFAECVGINFDRINNSPVAIFSLEMSKQSIMSRMHSIMASLPNRAFYRADLRDYEWTMLGEITNKIQNTQIAIFDEHCSTISQITSISKAMQKKEGLGLIIVDYLQKMQSSNSKNSNNRANEVAEFSAGLKNLAQSLKVPVIALAQLNRGVESRDNKRPVLSDLKDSGGIEQDADIVAFLYRDEYYKKKAPETIETQSTLLEIAEFIVAKNRNGPCNTVNIGFIPMYTAFRDLDLVNEPTDF